MCVEWLGLSRVHPTVAFHYDDVNTSAGYRLRIYRVAPKNVRPYTEHSINHIKLTVKKLDL